MQIKINYISPKIKKLFWKVIGPVNAEQWCHVEVFRNYLWGKKDKHKRKTRVNTSQSLLLKQSNTWLYFLEGCRYCLSGTLQNLWCDSVIKEVTLLLTLYFCCHHYFCPTSIILYYFAPPSFLLYLLLVLIFPSEWINAWRKDTRWAKNWDIPTWMNHWKQFAQIMRSRGKNKQLKRISAKAKMAKRKKSKKKFECWATEKDLKKKFWTKLMGRQMTWWEKKIWEAHHQKH